MTDTEQAKIIRFPTHRIVRGNHPPNNSEEAMARATEARANYLFSLSMTALREYFEAIDSEGFDITDESMLPEMMMVKESMMALSCKAVGVNHPLHELANDITNYIRNDTEAFGLFNDFISEIKENSN